MSKEVIEALRKQAAEIAREGHMGWGNTMVAAAEAREALLAERDALRDALEHCIDSLGSEYALPPECIKQARAALQGEQL